VRLKTLVILGFSKCNNNIKDARNRAGPPLSRLFCALIAQNNRDNFGPLCWALCKLIKEIKYVQKIMVELDSISDY
jgi:hypothetical protein